MNVGNSIAEGLHADALFVNDTKTDEKSIDRSLKPGEHYTGMFSFPEGEIGESSPDVIPPQVVYRLKVQTDVYDTIEESNETNNSLEHVWGADLTPPTILSQPTVNSITQTSAVISWITDELSDSRVEYGNNSWSYGSDAFDSDFVTAHNVTLTGLLASTTYHFVVDSKDPSGNSVQSRAKTFQTRALTDNNPPGLSIVGIPEVIEGAVNIEAQASDETGLEKVEFSIDDKLVFTDYSPPYTFTLDTSKYLNGPYKLTAKAFDLAGNPTSTDQTVDVENLKDATVPTVKITAPKAGDNVGGIVTVSVEITDDVGLDSARFYVNGSYTEYTFLDGIKYSKTDYTFDCRNLKDGTKLTFAVQTWDTSSNLGSANVGVYVYNVEPPPPPMPYLEVTGHVVSRVNNLFTITLEVQNVGDAPASGVGILDGMKGFQPISADLLAASYSANFDPIGLWSAMLIKPKDVLNAGESQTYSYNAVPVLTSSVLIPEIGYFIDLRWQNLLAPGVEYSNYKQLAVKATTNNESIPQAHAEAVKTCDYLLVTNPYELFAYYDPGYYSESIFNPTKAKTEVNTLLSTMAQLARYEQGTLGYFTWNYANPQQVLQGLIQQGGSWSSKLTSDWTTNGYLLIVGETEIIPTWGRVIGTFYTTKGDVTFAVLTDNPYANTFGEEAVPELSIGRIIGNNPKELTNVIGNSLSAYLGVPGHQFDRSNVLAASGFPGDPPNDIDFKAERDAVLKVIAQKTPSPWPNTMHTPDYTVLDATGQIDWVLTSDLIQQQLFSRTQDQDIIFLAAHGSGDTWDRVYTENLTSKTNPFGDTAPFVFASSCSTGYYFGIFSLAEAFLQKGAAVYLGATSFGLNSGSSQAQKFFELWDTNEPISQAVKQTKKSIGDDNNDKVWRAIYHVFGDAKFGATLSAASYASTTSPLQLESLPPSSVDVTIPDYTVTKLDGYDYVDIPSGLQLSRSGWPQLPYYRVLYEYPKDCRIQNVDLTHRSEPLLASDLNVPETVLKVPGTGATILQTQSSSDWFPDKDFEWTVYEGPESTTLAITIYPFQYNPLTMDAKFYKEYSFNVDYVRSNVKITGLKADKLVYELGGEVQFDLDLSNTDGNSKDIVVSAVIMKEGSDTVVGGSSLRSLMGLEGEASYSSRWSSGGADPGDYSLIVELRDTQGILLDKRITSFSLGKSSAEITSFDASPKTFHLGENVEAHLEFRNNGATNIAGTAIIRVIDSDGDIIDESDHEISDLMPSQSVSFTDTWKTTNVAPGSYDIVGFVLYEGKSTDPETVRVQTETDPPSIIVNTPAKEEALQDGVTLKATVSDPSEVDWVKFSIRETDGTTISPSFESMSPVHISGDTWQLPFNTYQPKLPDGNYLFIVNASDTLHNEASETVLFSIRNWATLKLLPATASNKAGRTIPIKFSLAVYRTVDPAEPFVYNEQLTIKIYQKGYPNKILQTSTYGTGSTNYRIDAAGKLYITNFKTLTTPMTYIVEIYRKSMLIGTFQFSTVR
jgi:hypothetical protein